MRRLTDSAKIYRLAMKHSVDDLVNAVVETVAANELTECYIRPLVMRSGEQMGVWAKDIPVETFVICYRWPTLLGDAAMEAGADVRVSSWRRAAPDTFPTLAKAGGNYLNSQLSAMEARLDEYAEGIMLDSNGWVAEGSGQNLFVVRDNTLYTAPISSGILHGITRDSIMKFGAELGYEVKEMVMPREFLYIADEAFFCGTAAEITPIRSDRPAAGRRRQAGAGDEEIAGAVHGHRARQGSRHAPLAHAGAGGRDRRADADARLPGAQLVVRAAHDGAAPTSAAPRD